MLCFVGRNCDSAVSRSSGRQSVSWISGWVQGRGCFGSKSRREIALREKECTQYFTRTFTKAEFKQALKEAEVPQEHRMATADKIGVIKSPFKLSSEHVHWGGQVEQGELSIPEYRDPDSGESTKWHSSRTVKTPKKKPRFDLD